MAEQSQLRGSKLPAFDFQFGPEPNESRHDTISDSNVRIFQANRPGKMEETSIVRDDNETINHIAGKM